MISTIDSFAIAGQVNGRKGMHRFWMIGRVTRVIRPIRITLD